MGFHEYAGVRNGEIGEEERARESEDDPLAELLYAKLLETFRHWRIGVVEGTRRGTLERAIDPLHADHLGNREDLAEFTNNLGELPLNAVDGHDDMQDEQVIFLIIENANRLYEFGIMDGGHCRQFWERDRADALCIQLVDEEFRGDSADETESRKALHERGTFWFLFELQLHSVPHSMINAPMKRKIPSTVNTIE